MKKFLLKFALYAVVFLLILELGCRVFADRFYFNKIGLYNSTKKDKVIFVGSSRVPATIDKKVFTDYKMNCVVAGRGYTTGGIHLTAFQHSLKKDPDYLKNANVFVEYSGNAVFLQDAERYQYQVFEPKFSEFDDAMPHVILPYLDAGGLKNFLTKSPNSLHVKVKLFFLYCSSAYRCMLMFQEKQPVKYILDKLFARKKLVVKSNLTNEGGIKSSNVKKAHYKAVMMAQKDSSAQAQSPLLTKEVLDRSILAKINDVVRNNGGKMHMFSVPLHTVQRSISSSERASENKRIFLQWLQENDISIIEAKGFEYNDNDFPDTWHLGVERRPEFSARLAQEIINQNIVVPQRKTIVAH